MELKFVETTKNILFKISENFKVSMSTIFRTLIRFDKKKFKSNTLQYIIKNIKFIGTFKKQTNVILNFSESLSIRVQ